MYCVKSFMFSLDRDLESTTMQGMTGILKDKHVVFILVFIVVRDHGSTKVQSKALLP